MITSFNNSNLPFLFRHRESCHIYYKFLQVTITSVVVVTVVTVVVVEGDIMYQ